MTHGSIAAGHPETCRAGLLVLEAGGNAFDAVVAAGMAGAVCEPALTSLGGGGFLLARPSGERARVFDFFVDTPGHGLDALQSEPHFEPVTVVFPGSEQVFNVGPGSCAVPGGVAGLLHVHEALGRLPLREVVAPAVALARDGVRLTPHQAYFLELLRPIVTRTAEARRIFAPEGTLLREGETLRNPDLAGFLGALPDGAAHDLYRGALGARLADAQAEGRGLITVEDLARYAVTERAPLEARFADHTLLTNPPPSFGGALLGLSLRLLGSGQAAASEAEHARHLLRVMRATDALRADGARGAEVLDGLDGAARDALLTRGPRATRGTTHVSVLDDEGHAASMTTSNGEASGEVIPGTGVLLNNMLGEDDLHPDGFHQAPAGQRVASMMAPSILLGPDGDLRLVLGSGGSKRIRTALLQVLSRVVLRGERVADAVVHPRLHWDGVHTHLEPGHGEEVVSTLADEAPTQAWPDLDVYFGGVHALGADGDGMGDPRRGGDWRRG